MSNTPTSATTLKTYFETGDIPTESQFSDFISSFPNIVDGNLLIGSDIAITAHAGGGQGSAYQITKLVSQITTCATAGDSLKLPAALTGTNGWILNATVLSCNVFPDLGSNFANGATNEPIALSGAYMLYYNCVYPGQWLFYIVSGSGIFAQVPVVTTSVASLSTSLGISNTYQLTAQAEGLTINQPGAKFGTNQLLTILIKDNGTTRAISYSSVFRGLSNSLPTTTVVGKQMYMLFSYNAAADKWDLINYSVEGNGSTKPRVYKALLTQLGTSAPTATVIENTTGQTVSYDYNDVGDYLATFSVGFSATKTIITVGAYASPSAIVGSYDAGGANIGLSSYSAGGTGVVDEGFYKTPFIVEIYP